MLCFGHNTHSQSDAPQTAGRNYTAVFAGGHHSCAIYDDGELDCWGRNFAGQTAVPPGHKWAEAALASHHTCGLTLGSADANYTDGGAILCFGNSFYGQADAPAGASYVRVGAADRFSCAMEKPTYDGTRLG